MISNTSVAFSSSLYENESGTNNPKAFALLNSVFPNLFQEALLSTLIDVQTGIDVVQKATGVGEVIVHIKGTDLNTELRANFTAVKKE